MADFPSLEVLGLVVAWCFERIAFLFAATRHFAAELATEGIEVDCFRLDGKRQATSFTRALGDALRRHQPQAVVVTKPGEWRVLEMKASGRVRDACRGEA